MKRSKIVLLATLTGLGYLIFIVVNIALGLLSDDDVESFLTLLIVMFAWQHILALFIGVLFNFISFFFKIRWPLVFAIIAYIVSIVLLPIWYSALILIPIVFSVVGFKKPKIKEDYHY